jgi:hypothetical protein
MTECFVISLDGPRFSTFCRRNEATGIDFKQFRAVDGAALSHIPNGVVSLGANCLMPVFGTRRFSHLVSIARIIRIGSVVGLLVMSGCTNAPPGSTRDQVAAPSLVDYRSLSLRLKLGMSEQGVIELLGQPMSSKITTCGQALGRISRYAQWNQLE